MTAPSRRQGDSEDFDGTPLRQNEGHLSVGWGKAWVKVRGMAYLVTVLLAVALAVIIWMNVREMQRTQDALANVVKLRTQQAEAVSREHKEIQAAVERVIEEIAWILTLPEAKRAAVHERLKTPERFR